MTVIELLAKPNCNAEAILAYIKDDHTQTLNATTCELMMTALIARGESLKTVVTTVCDPRVYGPLGEALDLSGIVLFSDAYEKLPAHKKAELVVILLTAERKTVDANVLHSWAKELLDSIDASGVLDAVHVQKLLDLALGDPELRTSFFDEKEVGHIVYAAKLLHKLLTP